jgi:hypothetical protein
MVGRSALRSGRVRPARVYDDTHISIWERGRGTTTALMGNGTNVTV